MLSISCVCDSPLDRLADRHIDLPWAFDESVCQTRTVSALYFAGLYLISFFTKNSEFRHSLVEVVEKGPVFLRDIETLCKEIASGDWDRAVVLGDAEIAGLCEEGALAFNEICQIPSNFYHLLDARHGPMVLIKPQTLVIAAISDASNKYELDMLKDLTDKGAAVVAVSALPVEAAGVINICWGGGLHHMALGLPLILTCQLISYYKSALTGANPDTPDGLDPWISL
jgi:fructoselysine-6-P-deglycase FrlB-like protein